MKRPLVALFLSLIFGIAAAKMGTFGLVLGLTGFGAAFLLMCLAVRAGSSHISRWACKKAYPMALSFALLIPVFFSAGYIRRTAYDAVTENERAPYLSLFDAGENEVILEGRIKQATLEDGKYELHLKKCTVRSAYGTEYQSAGGCIVYVDTAALSGDGLLRAGNTVKVYGKMKPYLKAANPGQFDAMEYHLPKREYAYVSAKKLWVTGRARDRFPDTVCSARNAMKDTLSRLYDDEQAGVLSAMLTGDKSLLEEETRSLYRKAGISHILAVSGL
ncbi:MAG: ComEC/Rec2 family competence protein, partial [Lachnospiraceae bacterium]|nr:ComEC/Rec2 family competence protein [Lachnospiraceae bacterium]